MSISIAKFGRFFVSRAISGLLLLTILTSVQAHPDLNRDCVSCHPGVQNRFEFLDFQKTNGTFRIYRVTAGGTAPITINITNGAPQHAASFYIANSAGKTNATDHLIFHPDPTWTARTNTGLHYMLPASGASTNPREQLVFNLTVDPIVPPDLYRATMQVAGLGWGQHTDFFIEVLPSASTELHIIDPSLVDGQFACSIDTTPATTYFLEYKSSPAAETWTVLGAPLAGDGTRHLLIDPGPLDTQRYYRVRAQP